MAHRALLLLLTLLLSFHLGFAQNSTQAPTPTITGATILTVPLQSLYTAHIQPTLTFEQTTTENGAVQTATVTWDLVGGIQASAVAVGAGYILNEFSDNDYAICWFQTSVSVLC